MIIKYLGRGRFSNKAGYTATSVAHGWTSNAGEGHKSIWAWAVCSRLKKLNNAKKEKRGPTDIAGCRVA